MAFRNFFPLSEVSIASLPPGVVIGELAPGDVIFYHIEHPAEDIVQIQLPGLCLLPSLLE